MKNNIKKISFRGFMAILIIGLSISSCKKFVEQQFHDQIYSPAIFDNEKTLTAALNGVYSALVSPAGSTFSYASLFSDELITSSTSAIDINAVNNTYNKDVDFGYYAAYYKALYYANAILEGIDTASHISRDTLNQVKGECLFVRAFCDFQLVNFYGTAPLVTSTDYTVSPYVGNTPVETTYKSIILDLQNAVSLLSDPYPATIKTRVNRQAANTLLAKAYLYTREWTNAAAAATAVINSGLYTLNPDLNSVFLSGSQETIWQYYNQTGYTTTGTLFVPASPSNVTYAARDISIFEPGDMRLSAWLKPGTGSASNRYYPYKYKLRTTTPGKTEYLIQFRLAEVYLIRAEALAQLNNISGGLADLDVVRNRAGLTAPLNINTSADLLNAVAQERRKELMFEASNRWFDLNRTGQTVSVLAPIKSGFDSHLMLLPMPSTAIGYNPNLVQNLGY